MHTHVLLRKEKLKEFANARKALLVDQAGCSINPDDADHQERIVRCSAHWSNPLTELFVSLILSLD